MNGPLYLPGEAGPAGATAASQPSAPGSAALLCDRDGTIIENRSDYVREFAHVKLLPGAVQALRRVSAAGISIVLLTNQSPIGRGILSRDHVLGIHRRLVDDLASAGVRIAGSFLCPHAPDRLCDCRKPAPGMVHAALGRFGLNASRTLMVGDAVEDMLAARRGGVRGVMVRTGRGGAHADRLAAHPEAAGTPVVPDLAAAVEFVHGLPAQDPATPSGDPTRPPAAGPSS
ncbi:D-glycero-alpha-D-manno-heptose-1,7-bisphosphate 7-phosphatase [Streptomyces sp. NPDC008001]|uniref:D-glycero-alpha-D-manno-heptose-1,7-bisphosphate 7-phosphatase n=1 Tax=Streptomyces sp. NPDC008001 TaxID=3364804 RepID=UPI0036E75EC0